MVLELIFGFLVLVAASYVGTTMALRGFFGRERYDASLGKGGDPPDGDAPRTGGDAPRTGGDAPRTDGEDPKIDGDDTRTRDDGVPRASDVSGRDE
jgi:hypothetical protein